MNGVLFIALIGFASQLIISILFGIMFSIFMTHNNKRHDDIFLAYLLEKHKGDIESLDKKRLLDYNVEITKKK